MLRTFPIYHNIYVLIIRQSFLKCKLYFVLFHGFQHFFSEDIAVSPASGRSRSDILQIRALPARKIAPSGDAVTRGQQLGSGAGSLYFELRSGGEPIDPTERLGL